MIVTLPDGWPATRDVVVIPARDEAARIAVCVRSFAAQGVAAMVAANGCTDDTVARAFAAGAAVLDLPAHPGGVGEARRIGMAAALDRNPGGGMIVTADADCRPGPGAAAVLRRALVRADAAFGRVVPDPAEFARLPRAVRIHGRLEDRRDALLAEIGAFAEPRVHDPMPRHGQAPGAMMAFRPDAYRAVGGFAPLPCAEDRDIARRLVLAGLRVAHPWDAVVIASCRLAGRAPGGMADTIAARVRSDLAEETARLRRECGRLVRLVSALRRDGPAVLDAMADVMAAARTPRLCPDVPFVPGLAPDRIEARTGAA